MESRERFARTILNGFESYFAEFQNITLAAKSGLKMPTGTVSSRHLRSA